MKTVFTTQEGVKMNSKLYFGNTKSISHEFENLMDTSESMWDVQCQYFYRVTDDKYIQLARTVKGSNLNIIAQKKLKHQHLKDNIISIVKMNMDVRLPYDGFPCFEKSDVFTEAEFNSIIDTIKAEKNAIIAETERRETPIIRYLKAVDIPTHPSGNNPNSWVANCPCGGQHHIYIVTIEDTWGCGYCKRKGKLPELKQWIQEIRIKKDQRKLSRMMQELKTYGSIQSTDLQTWWLNRY